MGADPMGAFEVHEQQPDPTVTGDVAHGEEHAVAVVAGEHDRGPVDDPYEPGGSSLVGHGRVAVGVDGAEEEERSGLDEGGRLVVDLGLDDDGFEHVGDPAAVELVLQNALLFSVEAAHDVVVPSCGWLMLGAVMAPRGGYWRRSVRVRWRRVGWGGLPEKPDDGVDDHVRSIELDVVAGLLDRHHV